MSIADSFRNAVACGDIKRVRIMMKDRLLVDPTFTEFDEMFNFVQNIDGLFDAHDGRELESNQSAWDDNYMNKLMVQVVGNFSYERLHHLKDVVRYLRPITKRLEKPPKTPEEVNQQTEILQQKSYKEQKRQDELDNCIIRKKVVTGGIAGGVVTGSVVAFVGGEYVSIVVGVVTGALVVGLVIAAEESL